MLGPLIVFMLVGQVYANMSKILFSFAVNAISRILPASAGTQKFPSNQLFMNMNLGLSFIVVAIALGQPISCMKSLNNS